MPQAPIPEISDDELERWVRTIRPLVRKDEVPWEIEPLSGGALRRTAFPWAPDFIAPAEDLTEIARLQTIHTYGAPAFFKPSVAEVIAQIPAHLRHRVTAFMLDTNDVDIVLIEGEGYHLTETILYGLPQREPAGIGVDQVSETRRSTRP